MKFMLRRMGRQIAAGLMLFIMQSACHAATLNWETAAILGQDADQDGVRDDVADFIQNHWQAADLRYWASEAAKASQAYLSSGGNRFALQRAHAYMERSRRCLTNEHGPQMANKVINRVLRLQLNNYERQQRYKEAVDQWVHKVSREDLPQQPDDNWNPGCGPKAVALPAKLADIPTPTATADSKDELPPPNFFLTRAMPEESAAAKAPSGSLAVVPLPKGLTPTGPLANKADDIETPDTGSWTTYSPRPRAQQEETPVETHLPVQKLKVGESAAVPASKPKPAPTPAAKSVAVQPLATPTVKQTRTAPQSRAQTQPSQAVIHPNSRIPAELRELAPFIRDVQKR